MRTTAQLCIYNPTKDDCDGNRVGDACDNTCLPETDSIFFYNLTCTIGGHIESTTCIQGKGAASRLCKYDGSWSDLIDTSGCLGSTTTRITTTRNGQFATPTTRNKSDWSITELVQCWNNISIGTIDVYPIHLYCSHKKNPIC